MPSTNLYNSGDIYERRKRIQGCVDENGSQLNTCCDI